MAEFSGFWSSGSTGDQVAQYTQAHHADMVRVIAGASGPGGVLPVSQLYNDLAGIIASANTFRIASGEAVVDGKWYKNTASIDLNVPSATGAGNTRIDRFVLRVSWPGYTVRITRIQGTNAANPSPPALTQTSGATYDLPLYQVRVNTSGTLSNVVDERVWASWAVVDDATLEKVSQVLRIKDNGVTAVKIASSAVTTPKIANDAVEAAKLASSSVETAKLATGAVTAAKLASNAVETDKILNLAVTNAKLAADSVSTSKIVNLSITAAKLADYTITDTKLGNRALILPRRQGGDVFNWAFGGTSNYTPGRVAIQVGAVDVIVEDETTVRVDYPQAFQYRPLVFLTPSGSTRACTAYVTTGTNAYFRLQIVADVYDLQTTIQWLAIGEPV
jgi:hypothetical protein